MLTWIRNWWWSRQRAIDMAILWPACREQAGDLDHAKAAFALHAYQDPAWIEFYGEDGLHSVISALK